ncbi:MAG: acetate--CoA ligase [Planctomycetes bacterium]|nr:acetate--CoA ligase [Planctomycetota bacterium]MBI3836057.1 acetate--CoA ligase [Planctomycetota bacterium]
MTSTSESTGPKTFFPSKEFSQRAHIKSLGQYKQMYERSIKEPEAFWSEIAGEFYWKQRWAKVREFDFRDKIFVRWFAGAKTNITYNALDRHLETRGEQIAILWEGNDVGESRSRTYRQLHAEVCKFANVLTTFGVKKGDRVSIYMPMIPELAIAMLACARIGAIHSIIFGGFSPDSLGDRIVDSKSEVLITADGVMRGSKPIALKQNADEAMTLAERQGVRIRTCIVHRRLGEKTIPITMKPGRDQEWADVMRVASPQCEPEWMDAEDPLFMLYTSGSTGKPKGALHTVGGYMVHVAFTFRTIFDYHDGDIFWCTADIGWVTGHSYIVYGPLCCGATSLMFEGIPTFPDAGRFWDVVDKYKVTQFYTAPTAIRALMREGEGHVLKRDLSSLRLLGSVGEPINPEAWLWYHKFVGKERCPIVDTWWQTETGGILMSPLPGAIATKPGSATVPFFGVKPVLMDDKNNRIEGPGSGSLFIEEPWPGIMRTVYGQHQRFKDIYFTRCPGMYFTGDGCRRDEDGYYWITGRIDDVINVSGHRLGTAEVESALVSHAAVAEAAVVGFPHEIKGQGIYAYVTLKADQEYTDALKKVLIGHVRQEIGAFAAPDVIHWAPGLPKTRSGKIMRRILRKIAEGQSDQIGDVTTLADPSVVEHLVKTK